MAFQVTSIYACILAVGMIVLALVVSTKRGKFGVAITDGGHPELALWIRKHGNFAEFVPFALFMMALAEAREMPATWLHVIGIVLLAARALHLFGINLEKPADPFRIAGAVGTHISMLGAVTYIAYSLL